MKYLIALLLPILLFSKSFTYTTSYFEDKNSLNFHNIKKEEFIKIKNNHINKGFNFNTFWIKVKIKNNSNKDIQKILYIDNPTIDVIDFYNNKKLLIQTGDRRTYKNKEINDIAFSFNISIDKNTSKDYYIKINTTNAFVSNFYIYDFKEYINKSEVKKLFLMFFFGFVLSIIIYNIFLFIVLKEAIFLTYIIFQIVTLLLLLSSSGFGQYIIWRDNYLFNEFLLKVFDDFSIILGLIFTKYFLDIKNKFKKINILINIILIILFYIMLTPWEYHSYLVKPAMLGSIVFILLITIYAVYKKISGAKLFFFAWLVLIIGALSTLFKNFGYLDESFFTTWSIYIGSMLEAIIFSIAMAKKIENKKQKKEYDLKQSEIVLNKEVKKRTKQLDKLLKEKTLFINEINHRIKNNLQIISSFINIYSMQEEEKEIRENYNSLNNRIIAISLIHNLFDYDEDNKNQINVNKYIVKLINNLKHAELSDKQINFIINIDNIFLTINKLTIVGLIINELVTNSIKYAFDKQNEHKIIIDIQKYKKDYIIIYQDNGKGFDINNVPKKSFGLKLINKLSLKQLNASIDFDTNKRVFYKFIFKDEL